MENHGATYQQLHPELNWDRRTGQSKIAKVKGDYNVLARLWQQTIQSSNDISGGLFTCHVSQPDEQGQAEFEAVYTTELTYQWTVSSQLQENSLYLGNTVTTWPSYQVGPSATTFILTSDGGFEVQTANYVRIVQGIETANRKGITWTDLVSTNWDSGSATGPYALYGYDIQTSASVGIFRQSYTQYDANHKAYVKDLYSLRMKDIETYPIQQVTLKRTALVNAYDSVDWHQDLIDKVWTKTAIKNRFGGASSPIPAVLDANLPESYWIYVGNQTDTMTSGKLNQVCEWWYVPQFDTLIYGSVIAS